MFEQVGQHALGLLHGLIGIDRHHLSTWWWLPLNLWLIWRLLRPLRALFMDRPGLQAWGTSGAGLALLAGLLAWQWDDLQPLAQFDLAMVLVQTLTTALLMVRVGQTLLDFRHLIRSLSSSGSVMSTVLRQGNLQRIMAARDVIGMVFLFVTSNAVYGLLTQLPIAYGLNLWAAASCLPLLILAFVWAMQTIQLRFRREARQMMLQGGVGLAGTLDLMERGLSEVAMRSAASQLLMREVFMSEIFRILATCAVALSARL